MAAKFKKVEYQERDKRWSTFPEVCKSCGLCIEKCPVKCLKFDESQIDYLGLPIVKCDITRCIACGTCQSVCPEGAIRVEGPNSKA